MCVLVMAHPAASAEPRNVIVFIGDGMGLEHVKAAQMYNGAPLSFEALPFKAAATTPSRTHPITDSAAAATAMATGVKVRNRTISMSVPGDESDLETTLEYYRDRGRATGLVTSAFMTHATPAAFGAHELERNNYDEIGQDYLNQTRPNVLLGGGANGMSEPTAQAAGYTVVTDRAELFALDTNAETYVSGQFGSYHLPYEYDGLGVLPHLSDMTQVAVDLLDNDSDGFFLMVEGAKIDHAAHANDIDRNIQETLEFAKSVQVVLDWAATRTDTLVLVTADHETGGMEILQDNGPGVAPTVSWSSLGHTATNVPVYGWGLNARNVYGVISNTEIHTLATMSEVADFDDDGDVEADDINTLQANMGGSSSTYDLDGNGSVNVIDLNYLLVKVLSSRMGDFNLDRLVDETDLAILNSYLGLVGGWAEGDLNGNGIVEETDLDALEAIMLSEPGLLAGDFNLDGFINVADLAVMKQSFGGPGGWTEGDLNGDWVVDATDLAAFRILMTEASGDAPAVPEPMSLLLLAAAAPLLLRRR
jgi:alkaline phosphatase